MKIFSIRNLTLYFIDVNPSTPRNKCWGLLRVDPEPRFFTPPLKAGLGAAEWVKISLTPHHPISQFCHSRSSLILSHL
jgi:hypothetical protein